MPLSSNHKSLADFAAANDGLGREAFVHRFGHAFLLLRNLPESSGDFETSDSQEIVNRLLRPAHAKQDWPDTFVVSVAKSDRNSFNDMVTLGRASNNDIVVSHDSVSKFHASIGQETDGRYTIRDAGSSFGTMRNLRPVGGDPVPLDSGDSLTFASRVEATFLTSEGLFDLLHKE